MSPQWCRRRWHQPESEDCCLLPWAATTHSGLSTVMLPAPPAEPAGTLDGLHHHLLVSASPPEPAGTTCWTASAMAPTPFFHSEHFCLDCTATTCCYCAGALSTSGRRHCSHHRWCRSLALPKAGAARRRPCARRCSGICGVTGALQAALGGCLCPPAWMQVPALPLAAQRWRGGIIRVVGGLVPGIVWPSPNIKRTLATWTGLQPYALCEA